MCFDSSHTVSAHGKEAQVRRQECFTRARRSEDDAPIDAFAVRHGNPRCRQSGVALLLFYHYYFLRWRKHQTVQFVVSRATPALTEVEFVWSSQSAGFRQLFPSTVRLVGYADRQICGPCSSTSGAGWGAGIGAMGLGFSGSRLRHPSGGGLFADSVWRRPAR